MENDVDRNSGLDPSAGGKARAKSLTPEERKGIAQRAAEARWERQGHVPLRTATHEGEIPIGNLRIPCAVLDGGTRVLSETGIVNALGLYRSGAVHVRAKAAEVPALPLFVANKNIRPFVDAELEAILSAPIWFRTREGNRAKGISATVLPRICNVWLRARDEGVLDGKRQELVALRADILMRGLAETGIIALVDEATGFQDERARNALAKILEEFVAKELQKWVSTFRLDYYEGLFKLWEIPYDRNNPTMKRPQFFGTLTNNIVYERLAPGVLHELRKRNPAKENGQRGSKHFQHLTPDLGHPKLKEHLAAVTALMRASKSKDQFIKLLDAALPKYKDAPLYNQPATDEGGLEAK